MKHRKPEPVARANPVAKYLKSRCSGGAGRHGQAPKAKRQQDRIQLRQEYC